MSHVSLSKDHAPDRATPSRRDVLGQVARGGAWAALAGGGWFVPNRWSRMKTARADVLPEYMTPAAMASVVRGLDYLVSAQGPRGNFPNARDGQTYPCAMAGLAGMAFLAHGHTTTRGSYRKSVDGVVDYLLSQAQGDGLIAHNFESGQPMYGHGFSTMFLGCAYGMENDRRKRARIAEVIRAAIRYIGMAQSNLGGWYYTANSGDEGSVTVTQLQALRACHNAGFHVPQDIVEKGVDYLEMCETPDGGIRYSYNSGNNTRLPITAAAVCCLYSAGSYDSELAGKCLAYTHEQFNSRSGSFSKGGGHDFYCHYYAAQAFYQAGDEYWQPYFDGQAGETGARDQFIANQQTDGSWQGDGIGPVYGTSLALVVLQLPYRYLPIYQR